jgi:hypothetical protein
MKVLNFNLETNKKLRSLTHKKNKDSIHISRVLTEIKSNAQYFS